MRDGFRHAPFDSALCWLAVRRESTDDIRPDYRRTEASLAEFLMLMNAEEVHDGHHEDGQARPNANYFRRVSKLAARTRRFHARFGSIVSRSMESLLIRLRSFASAASTVAL